MKLRPYQQKVIRDTYSYIRSGIKKILIFAPTGAGKTIISSQIVAHAVGRQRKVLFVVHREILINQTASKLSSFGITSGFIKSGWPEDRNCFVQIASMQTLVSRDWWRKCSFDVIVLDECHITAFSTIVQQMLWEIFPLATCLGLTATPWRLSKTQGMGDIFDNLVCAPMPHQLIDSGYLVKPSYYGTEPINLKGVKKQNGDYDRGSLAIVCARPEIIQTVVDEWQLRANSRRTIVFAVNVQHSQNLRSAFLSVGINAAHVDGTTPTKVRNQIYSQLATGEILVLCSCMALTEGFDVPSVSVVVLARPTLSRALYFQMVGRGLRLSLDTDKTDCLILDCAGNVNRHGFIEDLKEVKLTTGQSSDSAGVAPNKTCPVNDGGCGKIIHASYPKCPNCGYPFEAKRLTLELNLKRQLPEGDLERLQTYRQQLKTAYENNYAPSWAAASFKESYGHFPPMDWGYGAIFGERASKKEYRKYQKHLQQIATRLNKDISWIDRYLKLEFSNLFSSSSRG
ncbi:MAG: DEAD/DEAH box helicase [Prochloraceae cyanobacterium]|nr:DEAD/DEAH box helicase [Prochloraceae cyanobacterium]